MKEKIMPSLMIALVGALVWHSVQIQRQNQKIISKVLINNNSNNNFIKTAKANYIYETNGVLNSHHSVNKDGSYTYHWTGCFSDYHNWTKTSKKPDFNVPWSTLLFPQRLPSTRTQMGVARNFTIESPMRIMSDINGDGLLDFIYSNHYNESNNSQEAQIRDCVMLNNGRGFEIVYRCVATKNSTAGMTFYGDCADMSGN